MTCPPCTHDCNQGENCPAKNNNEIIEMARQAGMDYLQYLSPEGFEKVVVFSKLVAAKEREACAKLCENRPTGTAYDNAKACAAYIRARE